MVYSNGNSGIVLVGFAKFSFETKLLAFPPKIKKVIIFPLEKISDTANKKEGIVGHYADFDSFQSRKVKRNIQTYNNFS